MKWKIQIQWNDMKYLITNEAEKSTGGSLTSKTAFCNEVRVQFKLNVKTKLQLRESLSAGNILNVEENLMLRISWKILWPLDRIRRETSPFDFHSVNVEVISLNYWSPSTSTIWLQSFNDKKRFWSKTFLCQGNQMSLKSYPIVKTANSVAVLGSDIKVTLAICIIVVVLCIIRHHHHP